METTATIGSILAHYIFHNEPFSLLTGADFLAEYYESHPERPAYEAKLRTKSELTVLEALDIIKKFGAKQERAAASKLVREYHKMVRKVLKLYALSLITNRWRQAMTK